MPNPRTPFGKRAEAVKRRFQGLSRDEAAKGLAGAGVVTNAMKEFGERAESDGLERAAETFGVHETIENLLNQARSMRTLGLQFSEVTVGIKMHEQMEKLKIPKERRVAVLKAMMTIAGSNRPKRFIDTMIELAEHVESAGISYGGAVPRFDENVRRIAEKGEEERRKTRESAAKKEEGINRISMEQQAEVKRVEEEQERKLRRATEVEQKKAETAKKETDAARERRKTIERETGKKEKALEEIHEEVGRASKDLEKMRSDKKNLLDRAEEVARIDEVFTRYGVLLPEKKAAVLREVEKLGEDPKVVVELIESYGGLRRAVSEVKSKLVQPRKVLRQIGSETRKASRRLDKTQLKVGEAKQRLSDTKTQAKKAKRRLRYFVGRAAEAEGVRASLGSLRGAEAERKKNLEGLERRLSETLGKIAAVEKVDASIEGLKGAEASHRKALKRVGARLSRKEEELRATIVDIAKAHEVGESLDKLEQRMKELDADVISMTTKRDVSQRKDENEKKEMEGKIEGLSEELDKVTSQLDSLDAEVSNRISSLKPIADAYKFVAEGIGEPEVVVPLIKTFLANVVKWEAGRPGHGIVSTTEVSEGARMILMGLGLP
jgi:myosin heavy subunit